MPPLSVKAMRASEIIRGVNMRPAPTTADNNITTKQQQRTMTGVAAAVFLIVTVKHQGFGCRTRPTTAERKHKRSQQQHDLLMARFL
jgi:hypothetical protein